MDTRLFHKRLHEATADLLPDGASVLCAVSGGADSMALLHGLHQVNRFRRRGWTIFAAHLDHGLPNNAVAMADFVQHACNSLDISMIRGFADVPALSDAGQGGIEEAGRRARYDFLRGAAEEVGATRVAAAHHADDQAETVLNHILRGSGFRGLAGMPASRPIAANSLILLVRPLLAFRRRDLCGYLQRRGLKWMHDATNDDLSAAARNRIRHQVLPLVEQAVNPGAVDALLRLAEQARRAESLIAAGAEAALPGLILARTPGELTLDARRLAAMPEALAAEVVVRMLNMIGLPMQQIGFERIEALRRAAGGVGRRRVVELPGGAVAERRGTRLIIRGAPAECRDSGNAVPKFPLYAMPTAVGGHGLRADFHPGR